MKVCGNVIEHKVAINSSKNSCIRESLITKRRNLKRRDNMFYLNNNQSCIQQYLHFCVQLHYHDGQ